jgi:ubiquinone biosynthesis protein
MRLRLWLRLLVIQRTLVKYGLDDFVKHTHLFRPLVLPYRLVPSRWRSKGTRGERLRTALEELGPVFIKFGQALSMRRDLLPVDIADELAKLQDRVPPFASERAVETLERALGQALSSCFAEFDPTPLAAASIAQVHAARLPDGREAVVKILRPGVKEIIRRDLEVLFAVAELAERFWPLARRLHPIGVVAEFEKTLYNELDLMREAANAAQLKRNFADSDQLYVPEIYWDYCRTNVLTLERVHGVPIGDVARLKALGTDLERLAHNGVDIFFTQVFRHNFFHADMHPGNIFVDVTNPSRPKYVAVDFGIMGSLSPEDQRYLAGNFLAFFRRDYREVAALHVDSGWVPEDTRVEELEAAVRAVCEPIFNKPLNEISFGLVLVRLFETARRFNMEVQPQLVLLEKTLLAIEGLGRELFPTLDLWTTAKPVLEEWMRERTSPAAHVRRLARDWPKISEDLLLLPDVLHALLRDVRRGKPAPARASGPGRGRRGVARALAGLGFLLAGVLWHGLGAAPDWLGWVGIGLGALLLAAASLV